MALVVLAATPAAAHAGPTSFVNATQIAFPGTYIGPATPYPSSLSVSGLSGTVSKASVLLIDVGSGGNTEQLDLVLVGPSGQKVMLWSDACGTTATYADRDYLFEDAQPGPLPDNGPCPSGGYRPSNYVGGAPEPDSLNAGGGPLPPYGNQLSAFNGSSPNGTWSLYSYSDSSGDYLTIGAWALTLEVQPTPPAQTGERAAALEKCKKKHSKKARKKCRKKARQLPV